MNTPNPASRDVDDLREEMMDCYQFGVVDFTDAIPKLVEKSRRHDEEALRVWDDE